MTIEEMVKRKTELGYSYKQISALSGLPLSTVQKVLGGITKAPRYETLQALEGVLKAPSLSGGSYQCDKTSHSCFAENTAIYKSGRTKNSGYTIKDYYALPDEKRSELIDGSFYEMEAPIPRHQIIALEIGSAFLNYVKRNNGGCIPLISPVDVQLDMDDKTVVQPDVLIVCDKNKVTGKNIFGAPDLIAEILSPSTQKRDTSVKLKKYFRAGVREYWIVDPDERLIFVYKFAETSAFRIYDGTASVPVGIWGDACAVNFKKIFDYLDSLEE